MSNFFPRVMKRLGYIPIPQQVTPQFPDNFVNLNNYSMSGPRVLEKLYAIGQDVVARGIPGDFVECGTCNGGSAGAILSAMPQQSIKAWIYDSFQGLPETKDVDGDMATSYVGKCVGAVEMVKEAIAISRFPIDQCVIREGWFQDTFTLPLPERISVLHADCDWYDSVLLTLDTFYDRVADGGVIILDDFGHWEGCREAFYDFCTRRNIKPLLERFGHTQAFWVKGRTDNRAFSGKWEIP